MKKILFVCLGNICRSAMAQGILEHHSLEANLPIQVDSAGTSSYHIGQAPDSRAIETIKNHRLDISHQKARQFSTNDFEKFDLIFAMDESNYHDIIKLASSDEQKNKVDLFLNLSNPTLNLSVPDPYFGGNEGFEDVFQMLTTANKILIDRLQS